MKLVQGFGPQNGLAEVHQNGLGEVHIYECCAWLQTFRAYKLHKCCSTLQTFRRLFLWKMVLEVDHQWTQRGPHQSLGNIFAGKANTCILYVPSYRLNGQYRNIWWNNKHFVEQLAGMPHWFGLVRLLGRPQKGWNTALTGMLLKIIHQIKLLSPSRLSGYLLL